MPLDRLRLGDAGSAGRKAATLGELSRSGFAVPEGFVLCADALEEAYEAAGGIPARIELPARVRDALAGAVAAWPSGMELAVRSSSVAEDLGDRSYAGQYESVLRVAPAGVEDAVRTCWASAFGDQVRAYGGRVTPRMAVIVQRMVPASAAGVAFSANPVTGDRAEAVVNAVRGLGDRLAAGTATQEEWHVQAGGQHGRQQRGGDREPDLVPRVAQRLPERDERQGVGR